MTRGLAIVGYGKMGRMIERLAPEYGFEVKARFSGQDNNGARALTAQSMIGVDVAVEFTRPEVATANLKKLAAVGVASVCGTTGWYAGLQPLAQEIGVNGSALVWGANFSVGLNLFRRWWPKRRDDLRERKVMARGDGRFITQRRRMRVGNVVGVSGRDEAEWVCARDWFECEPSGHGAGYA